MKNVDLVIPVFNEEEELRENVLKVHAFLVDNLKYDWKIIITSNGSTDRTVEIGTQLADDHERISLLDLKEKGRGNALKKAWLKSNADVLSYMDIDLSADLKHYPSMIQAVVDGYDLAVGSRLAPGSDVSRGLKREFLSRSYNLLIRYPFQTKFSDAQCGFKAISQRAAKILLPQIKDTQWFFDSELLIVAEKAGFRIYDLPIAWVDDPGSTVKILKTAKGDLEGLLRLFISKPWRGLKDNV